ncbi:MAG TPA: polysaccharide biosynthesis tyrosine autokinase [Methylocella sp.]|nr:polysaccharide biosynthesis tyrosine autokinase [Methylocella sp.]
MLYYFITPASYTAGGTIVIDKRKLQLFQKESVLSDAEIDTAAVQTEVEVLKSDNIGLAVVRKLHLTTDPEFASAPSKGLIERLTALLRSRIKSSDPEGPPTEADRENAALRKFNAQRTLSRVGMTYVIDIGFTSHEADKSARIVNALADAYFDDQLNAKYQATRRASLWLQERIAELRTQATAAERAVLDFKGKNNIVDAGGGRLINDQQLVEVNSQLILARAATAEAKARLDRIDTVMSQDIPDASVADALKSEVIIKLRGQYLEIAQREAIWSKLYGENHLAAINLRTQMEELRRSIKDEMRKIAESYKSDYEIALTRQNSLEASLANVVSQSQATGQAQIQLRELESNAETSRALYDSFLQRYMEAVQQQSVPISEARLISPAMRPQGKSAPKLMTVLLATFASGAFLSLGIAYLREAWDGTLRTTDQVEDTLHFNCLAMVPVLRAPTPRIRSNVSEFAAAMADRKVAAAEQDWFRYAVDSPFSRYAEAIRSVKIAADLSGAIKSHKVIGVTSTLPNEGKSTIAANLAHLIGDAGGSVILVDADLRSPSLSRKYAPQSRGSIGAVLGNIALEDAIVSIPFTNLHFLPAGATARLPHTNEVLASAAFKKCVDVLRTQYDYIIVDLSPVAPIVDVRATGHFIDTYVYVAEWGKTKIEVIERALADAESVTSRLLGVVLNKVDTSTQSRYELYHSHKYHQKYYAKYGYME